MIGLLLAVAAGAAMASSPAAPAQEAPGASKAAPACFFVKSLEGHRRFGDHAILLRAGVGDIFELDFGQGCPDLDLADQRLTLRPATGTGLICRAIDVQVAIGPAGAPPDLCIPQSLRRLTPEEVQAIPKADRP